MKNLFLNWSISLIQEKNPNLDKTQIKKIKYGLEGLYLTVTKLIIIIIISFIFNIVNEFIIFCLLYNGIRIFAFGMHASKSFICLVSSIGIFVVIPYISKIITLPIYIKILIAIFCLIMIVLYAPADTHKRPLIKKQKRYHLKLLSTIICIIYIVLSLILKNNFISNSLLFSLLTEVILILPVTYMIFGVTYNNYRYYHEM